MWNKLWKANKNFVNLSNQIFINLRKLLIYQIKLVNLSNKNFVNLSNKMVEFGQMVECSFKNVVVVGSSSVAVTEKFC